MKVHLASADEPLVAGQDQDAACGKTVPKAVFLFVFDMGVSGTATLSSLLCCRKCVEAIGREQSKHYLYGVAPGEETLHSSQANQES